MRLRIIWVGKTKNEHVAALADDYLKRVSRFARCEVTELAASRLSVAHEGIAEEGRRILSALRADSLVVLLDVGGREWSSPELAAAIQRWQVEGKREVAFVVGGHNGVSQEVSARADLRWSLSRLTLTHELIRPLLLEQIYRAYTIIHGLPYQK